MRHICLSIAAVSWMIFRIITDIISSEQAEDAARRKLTEDFAGIDDIQLTVEIIVPSLADEME